MSIRKLHLPPVIIVTIVRTTQNKLKKKNKKKLASFCNKTQSVLSIGKGAFCQQKE